MSCVIKYKGLSIPEENFIEHLQKLISINDMFDNLEGFADGVYEDLGFGQESNVPTSDQTINIYASTNENAELSNFAIRPFTINVETPSGEKQYTFQSVEQGFHFHKALIANNPQVAKQILATTNGGQLRRLTNRSNLKMTPEQVKEWDDTSKSIMLNLMYESYAQNPKAAEKLLATGNAKITHTQDNTRWKTDFPEVVMTVRDMLREEGFGTQSQITQQQKQQAIQIYSRYITEDVEGVGFKNWIKGIKTLDYQSELLNLDDSDEILYQIPDGKDAEETSNIKSEVEKLFNENPELANAVYEALGFESKQENASEIYNKLGGKTKEGNVIIKSVYQQVGVQYAKSIDGVFSLRVNGTNNHFGNPFSSVESEIQKGLIRTKSTRESVEKYIEWVLSPTTTIKPEQHKFIRESLRSGKLKGKPIVYYKELGEPSHATALDYLINKYNWNNQITPQQKQQAQQLYAQYLSQNPNGSVEGFKSWINSNQSDVQYQLPQGREIEEFVASEKTIRDLAARMSDRIGIPVKFESDRTKKYKGKLDKGIVDEYGYNHEQLVAVINLAYATLDTPIHEILGHPIIRAIKDINPQLYQNLLKELEYGKGKEVLDRIKRDYVKREAYNDYENLKPLTEEEKKLGAVGRFFTRVPEKYYTLEEQQEEALVELLGLYTAGRLDKVKDGKLISLLKRLLKEIKAFMKQLLGQKEVEIDKLPDNMTLGDIADLLAYSNSKLILPGNEVVYTTPDNQQFKTYQEASNHISELAKSVEDVDLSDVKVNLLKTAKTIEDVPDIFIIDKIGLGFKKEGDTWYYTNKDGSFKTLHKGTTTKVKVRDTKAVINAYNQYIEKQVDTVKQFIEKNKQYEQSKEIIEEWKRVNNIQYNPEEVYSRGQEFVSVVGAYSDFDVNLMMQNLLQHIEDNQKAGGEFVISAFTKPVDRKIRHLEGGGGKIKFKIYPRSQDIKWAANTDVYSGSVWDASEKVSKDKKSELLGVSYTKYPSLQNINEVQPNLASIIDNLAHHHNELGISLTGSNFRLEYDEDVPYSTKKIIDNINSILDQKYGKLVKPEIKKAERKQVGYSLILDFNDGEVNVIKEFKNKEDADKALSEERKKLTQEDINRGYEIKVLPKIVQGIQPTQTNETLKESIYSVKDRVYVDDSKYDLDLKRYEQAKQGIIPEYYSAYPEVNGKKIHVFALNTPTVKNEVGMWQNEEEYDLVKDYIVGETENAHGVKFWILSDKFKKEALQSFKKPVKSEKEYTEQALINLRIAKLKEVAKKYPRSLIRSEVRPIPKYEIIRLNLGFAEDELPFQKVSDSSFQQFQQSLNNPNTNPILQGNHEEQLKKFAELQERLNNKEFLEGAKNVYESSEELQEWGTQEQYNDYIARVSLGIIKNPSSGEYNYESKVRDIVYHGTDTKFDKFNKSNLPDSGIYFDKNKTTAYGYGNVLIPAILNSSGYYYGGNLNRVNSKQVRENGETGLTNGSGNIVFEPEQIHILGSKQDIEGFREFVNNVKNNSEDVSEYDKYFGDVISDENVTDQNDNNLQDTFLQKENESKLPSNKELDKMMQIFLEKIGVRINAVDHIKDASGKKLNAIAKADIMSKIIDVVQGKADITTLPEEAGHFFVELLPSNSPLLHEMMNKITSYKIYGQVYEQYKKIYTLPDGSPDFVKIKKEAIGKLIAQHIIKDFKGSESDSKLTSIKNWFRKVIDYILSILHKAGFVVENPFEQVAKQILAADTTGLKQEASVRSELYQLDPDGNIDAEVEDVIDVSSAENKLMEDQSKIVLDNSIDPVTKQKRHVYTYEGKKVKSSVTQKYVDPWIRKIYNTDTRSEIQKIIDLEKAHYGDLSHEEMQGIVSSWTNPDGTLKSEQGPHQIVTNKTVYDKLNNLFQQIASQYPEGTKFKAEVKIYDKIADVAGSIDLLVIQPNGVVDIYDWKTQEIHKDQTELKWYKEKMYQIQLENYRKILEMEYGFVKFGKIRAIPIATKFQYSKKGIIKLLDIEVGDVVDPRNIPDEKSYLLPVTLMGESTGNDMLDEFIGRLEGIYKKIGAVRYKNEEYYKRIEELAKIKTSIRDIRLRGDINKFIDLGIIEYNKFKKKLDNGELTGRDLLEAQRIMKVFEDSGKCLGELLKEYKKAAEESKDPDALKNYEKTRNRLFNMSQSASALLVEMVKYNNKQSEQLGQKEGIFNLLKPEAPIGALNGLMTALSGITHKSFRLFSNLLRFEQNKRDVEFKNYVEESEKMKKKFLDYCKKKGITPIKAMNMLLDIDENGNWSGNFIRKYKKEFSKEREQALRKGDVKWFIDNIVYDEELHQKYLEAEKKITELYNSIVYSLDEETQKKEVEKRIKLWKEKYQVIKDDETLNYQALMNPSNRFVRPVDKWLTEEWNEIHNNKENTPLKEVYEFFQKTIRKAEELGMLDGYNPRFIPSIYASKLDQLVFGDISKLFSSEGFFENLQVDAGNQYTPEIDPVDGTIINRIPVYFTNDIGVKREDGTMDYSKKSRDLFKVFTVFAAHMYNYEAMSNLEDSALMLLEAERNKKSLVTDNFGNLVFENGMVKAIDSNDKNAKMLEDFVNFYLYDRISGAGSDAKFKLFGKEYSVLKGIRKAMSFFSLKTLGLNPISGTAQFVGGTGNALFTAQKGIMFTKTQWVRGIYRCVSSKKAKAAIKYFDARLEGTKNYDINDASLSKANSILNADAAFFIQRKSDAGVQDPILLTLMENHMLTDDGRIVKIDTYVKEKYDYNNSFYNKSSSERKEIRKKIEAEVKELQKTKSLFAIGKIDDEGKFYIPGLDKKSKEFSKFKDKVKAVSKTIIGNSSHDDINRIRTTILGMALMQFRNWIPAMVAERFGKFKYNDALETYTIGKFNLFLSEMFSSKFPSLIKSLLLGFGTDGIAAAKAKYQEMKREAYEKGEEWTITEGEFIDLYIGSLRSQMLELIVILSFVGLMFALFSSGDDDDKPRDGFLMYLSRAMDKYKQEFLFYYDPREFTNLVRTPIPVIGLLEDFYRFVGAFAKQLAGVVTSNEEMMDKAKPGKYFLRMVPGFNPALVLMAAYDDEFRKEWGIKVTIN